MKWHRIGYIEGKIKVDETAILTARSILYVRDPFLWFKTRKVVEIGDVEQIRSIYYSSTHYREYQLNVENWLLGGKIDYVSDNGTSEPAKIIRLIK